MCHSIVTSEGCCVGVCVELEDGEVQMLRRSNRRLRGSLLSEMKTDLGSIEGKSLDDERCSKMRTAGNWMPALQVAVESSIRLEESCSSRRMPESLHGMTSQQMGLQPMDWQQR